MKHLAQCVIRYAQCLWQAQPLLPQQHTPHAVDLHRDSHDARARGLVEQYLASLLASLAALPPDQHATLTLAGRMGLRPVLVSQRRADPVRDALIAGESLIPPAPVNMEAAPWRDASLAAIVLRSLQYALDLSDALPDPHAATPMTGLSGEQHAALWSAAHAIDEQQAALWDAVESISTDEADLLADAARASMQHLPADSPHAELLAYFASGMFAQRVSVKG